MSSPQTQQQCYGALPKQPVLKSDCIVVTRKEGKELGNKREEGKKTDNLVDLF